MVIGNWRCLRPETLDYSGARVGAPKRPGTQMPPSLLVETHFLNTEWSGKTGTPAQGTDSASQVSLILP